MSNKTRKTNDKYEWEPFQLFNIENMYKKDCPGDGNCQFHTIANIKEIKKILFGPSNTTTRITQQVIREAIAEFVEKDNNNNDWVNLLWDFAPKEDNNYETADNESKVSMIVKNIRKSGFDSQGTHQTLAILAKILNYIFIVFKDNRIDVVYPLNQDKCEKCNISLLYFTEMGDNSDDTGHYQLLGLMFVNKKGKKYYQSSFLPNERERKLLIHKPIKDVLQSNPTIEENPPIPKIEIIPPQQLINEEPEIVESIIRSKPIFTTGFVDGLNKKIENTDFELLKNMNSIIRNQDTQNKIQNKINIIDNTIQEILSKQNKKTKEINDVNTHVLKLEAEKKELLNNIRNIAAKTKQMSKQTMDQRNTIKHYLDTSNKALLGDRNSDIMRGAYKGRYKQMGAGYGPPLLMIDKATRSKLNKLAIHWNINYKRFKTKQDLQKALRYVIYFKTNEVKDFKSYKVIGSIYNLPPIRTKKKLKEILDQITLRVTTVSIIKFLS